MLLSKLKVGFRRCEQNDGLKFNTTDKKYKTEIGHYKNESEPISLGPQQFTLRSTRMECDRTVIRTLSQRLKDDLRNEALNYKHQVDYHLCLEIYNLLTKPLLKQLGKQNLALRIFFFYKLNNLHKEFIKRCAF